MTFWTLNIATMGRVISGLWLDARRTSRPPWYPFSHTMHAGEGCGRADPIVCARLKAWVNTSVHAKVASMTGAGKGNVMVVANQTSWWRGACPGISAGCDEIRSRAENTLSVSPHHVFPKGSPRSAVSSRRRSGLGSSDFSNCKIAPKSRLTPEAEHYLFDD